MKLMASMRRDELADGLAEDLERARERHPQEGARKDPPAKTAVPGRASAFRSMIAVSPVGVGTTGGTRIARLCRPGNGKLSAAKRMYLADARQGPQQDEDRRHRERRPGLQHGAHRSGGRTAGASAAVVIVIRVRRLPHAQEADHHQQREGRGHDVHQVVSTKFDQ